MEPGSWQKFAFFQFERPLGAALMATPVFAGLRRQRPDSHITAFCGPMAMQVLAHNPNIDVIVPVRDPIAHFAKACSDTFLGGFGQRFDCAIADASNARAKAQFPARLVRAGFRLGFGERRRLMDRSLPYDFRQSVLANNLRLLDCLGLAAEVAEPELFFSAADAARAQAFLLDNDLAGPAPVVAIASQVSGGYPEKRTWPAPHFAAVANRLFGAGCRIVFLGTKAEEERIESIRSLMSAPSVSAAGKFTISGLGALLADCDLLATLDTGTLHAARAVGLPAVVIARPWQAQHEWLPVGIPAYQILSKPDLVMRAKSDPGFDVPTDITEITVAEVIRAAMDMLDRYPANSAARDRRRSLRLGRVSD